MPNQDKTGPSGQGFFAGRRRGRWFDTQPVREAGAESRPEGTKEIMYGVGRGGKPRGGGQGNCYGGKGKGRRFYN
jgi:hypothetical protein